MVSSYMQKLMTLNFCPQVHEGEALDLMEAIRWLRSMNMDIVIFEVDSQRVYNGMKRRSLDPSEFGIIIMQCKECLFGQKAS